MQALRAPHRVRKNVIDVSGELKYIMRQSSFITQRMKGMVERMTKTVMMKTLTKTTKTMTKTMIKTMAKTITKMKMKMKTMAPMQY